MHMMSCPKCGFEQPQDQFCAKCGVNVDNFKPTVAFGSGLSSLLKPFILVAVVIALIFFLFKSVENRIITPQVEVEESTRIGSGASSLKVNRAGETGAPAEDEVASDVQPTAARMRVESTDVNTLVAGKEKETPSQKFNQVTATFTLGEHGGLDEASGKNWYLTSQASPNYTSQSEEVVLKTGNNTFVFEDELIVYDLNFFVEEITDKDVKVKMNIKRTLRARAQDGPQTNSFSINEKIPLDQTLIIIDALPRRVSIDRPNSILSTIYKSQSFVSHASEVVQIVKFENPSNSSQEELTP